MKNQSTVKNLLGGLQWALYMISTGIVMPVVIGQSYHLSPSDASMYIQVTLLCIGLLIYNLRSRLAALPEEAAEPAVQGR